MTISRRNFMKGCLAGVALGGAGGMTQKDSTFEIQFSEVPVQIRDLPQEFEHYRIAFVTDFHLGSFVPDEWVEHALSLIAKAKPDLLLLGGDYQGIPDSAISKLFGDYRNSAFASVPSRDRPEAIFSRFVDILSIVSTPDGTAAVLGNHDRRNSQDACVRELNRRSDLVLLENASHLIRRGNAALEIVGSADYLTGIPALPLPHPEANARVLLTHNPDYAPEALGVQSFDLVLAGHTHGGQLRLPGIGVLTYNISDLRFGEGLNWLGSTPVYTSRGIGVVEVPYRLNCPAEANVFVLKSA